MVDYVGMEGVKYVIAQYIVGNEVRLLTGENFISNGIAGIVIRNRWRGATAKDDAAQCAKDICKWACYDDAFHHGFQGKYTIFRP